MAGDEPPAISSTERSFRPPPVAELPPDPRPPRGGRPLLDARHEGYQEHMAQNVAEGLKSIEVLDPEGRPQRLGDLWRNQPVVLVFIRHFG